MSEETWKAVQLLEFLAAGLRSGQVTLHQLDSGERYADTAGFDHDGLYGELRMSWLRPDPRQK